jgi:hypothetical protein
MILDNTENFYMDKIVSQIAALGVPGLVLLFFMAISGYAGAAAITTALAALGGPFGMLGGIGVLILLAKISPAITEYGLENIAKGVVIKMKEYGKTKAGIISEINNFPLISTDLKKRLTTFVGANFS